MEKITSGIPSLDLLIDGGMSRGSLILLLGEVGSGHYEFAYTSAAMIAERKKKSRDTLLPSEVYYISITRTSKDILNEIGASFRGFDPVDIRILDLSETYFRSSRIPLSWIADTGSHNLSMLKGISRDQEVLSEIVTRLDEYGPDNLIIIDSLTALIRVYSNTDDRWSEFIRFLQGLQRVSKRWGGIIYMILTANVFERAKEEEIADVADGAFFFRWEEWGTGVNRRSMIITKLKGDLPRLEDGGIVKFEVNISSYEGLTLVPIRQILGRG